MRALRHGADPHQPARQSPPTPESRRDNQNPHRLLRDKHAATIMGSPRHRDSHPDCRRLPIQIAALQMRKTPIVALARKLLIALWRYTTAGVVIEGAVMKAAPATI